MKALKQRFMATPLLNLAEGIVYEIETPGVRHDTIQLRRQSGDWLVLALRPTGWIMIGTIHDPAIEDSIEVCRVIAPVLGFD